MTSLTQLYKPATEGQSKGQTPITWQIREHLGHEWTDELVGFPWEGARAPRVTDDAGQACPAQLSGGKAWFRVECLPAFATLNYQAFARAGEDACDSGEVLPCARAQMEGDTVIIGHEAIALRVPATQNCAAGDETGQHLPAPILGVRLADGCWLGQGSFHGSPDQAITGIRFEIVEEGVLWCAYAVVYQAGERDYRVEYRFEAGNPHVCLTEHSRLGHDAEWLFDIYPGFAPTQACFGHHRTQGKTRVVELDYSGRQHLGDVQAPDQNMHFFVDDFDAFTFLHGATALGLVAARDGDWSYIPQNPISLLPRPGLSLVWRAGCKAGHRVWHLFLAATGEIVDEGDYYTTPAAKIRRKYQSTLDWVKDLVLAWKDKPDTGRPFVSCTREDLARARRLFREFPGLRQYGEFIDRDAELVQGQYDSGGHYPLNDAHREDPMCAWLMKPEAKIAEKLKRGLLKGLRIRVDAFLGPMGHNAPIITSINLGRTLRPFLQMFDILAPHLQMTDAERAYFMAAAAFLAYKVYDPHYWNADGIVLHSDHPKSCHRTAWFPSRESDWCTYNIDTTAHNFHIDLYAGAAGVGLVFPAHPQAKVWVDQALSYTERELDNWVFSTGAYIESATYTLGTFHWWTPYFAMLKNARVKNYFLDERVQRMGYALAREQGPYDARIRRHSFTVMGDAMYPSGGGDALAWLAHLGRDDAQFSAAMMGAWERSGRQLNNPGQQGLSMYDALFIDPDLPAEPLRGLPSEHVDGLGLILRHAHGTPEEVYFFLKCGKVYSHFHSDEGSFFTFAGQAPILDEYGVQYGFGTNELGESIPGHLPRCHNGISFSETPTDRECYNRGFVTRFLAQDYADYAVCEMPIHLLYMKPGVSLWGFQGEEAPYGWWRRHILYIKPHGFFFYDEIETEFSTTLDLNFKADSYTSNGTLNRIYHGRYGLDIPVCVNFPLDGQVYNGRLDMRANESSFAKFSTMESVAQEMKDSFYNQISMHVKTGAMRDFSWAFGWGKPEAQPRLRPLRGGAPGSCLSVGGNVTRALVAPWLKEAIDYRDAAFCYTGWAGASTERVDGKREFIQMSGRVIGRPKGWQIEGDGPFRVIEQNGLLEVEASGRARWLTFTGIVPETLTLNGKAVDGEKIGRVGLRVLLTTGCGQIRARLKYGEKGQSY